MNKPVQRRPDWDQIDGKPATFPPTLPIDPSGVTDLVPALNGISGAITDLTTAVDNVASGLSTKVEYADYELGNLIDADSWYTKFTNYFQPINAFLSTLAGINATTGTGAIARATLPTFADLIIGNSSTGPRLRQTSGVLEVVNAANTAFANLLAATISCQFFGIRASSATTNETMVFRNDQNYIGMNADKRLVWSSSTGSNNFFSGAIGLSLARVDATTAAFYTTAAGTTLANLQVANLSTSGTITVGTSGAVLSNQSGRLLVSANGPGVGLLTLQNTSVSGYTAVDLRDNTGNTTADFGWGNASVTFGNAGAFYLGTNTNSPVRIKSNGVTRITLDGSGNVAMTGTLSIGGGTSVSNILSATATLDFAAIAANSFQDLTITVTGATSGDSVTVNPIAGSAINDVVYTAWVSAANTVTVRASNVSATTARDPASGLFRATVIRF